MVDINGKSYSDIIKIKGTDKKIDLTKLEGLQKTEKNKAIFDMVDKNKDGVIDKDEAKALQGTLLNASNGDGKLTKQEAKRFNKEMNTFEAISALADQQKAYETGSEYRETNGDTTNVYSKGYSYSTIENGEIVRHQQKGLSYQEQVDENSMRVMLEDGTQELVFKDGRRQVVQEDGSIITYDKDGNKLSTMHDGKVTTFTGKDSSETRNLDGQLLQTIKDNDGVIVRKDYEYQDGKIIEREYSDVWTDAPLTGITVKEKKDGHNVETKYATEEDMANGKPSVVVTDDHNDALRTETKYTYNEDGSYSTETTDSAGTKTVKNFNADGTEITETPKQDSEEVKPETETTPEAQPEALTTHKVVKGESITRIVTDALKEQGIENPTPEQLKEAKKEFLELNKDLVKTYNGVRPELKGNKFFYPDDEVKIPNFNGGETVDKTPTEETEALTTHTVVKGESITGIVTNALKEQGIENPTPEQLKEAKKEFLELNKDLVKTYNGVRPELKGNKFFYPDDVVKIPNFKGEKPVEEVPAGETEVPPVEETPVEEVETPTVQENESPQTEIDSEAIIEENDQDNSKTLNKAEYEQFIMDVIGYENTPENRAKFQNLLDTSFQELDSIAKDGQVSKEELDKSAAKVFEQVGNKINDIEQAEFEEEILDSPEIDPNLEVPAADDNKPLTNEEINANIDNLKPGESYQHTNISSYNWGSGSSYESKPITWTRNEDGTFTKTEPEFTHTGGIAGVKYNNTTYAADRKTLISMDVLPENLKYMGGVTSTKHFKNGKATHLSTNLTNLDNDLSTATSRVNDPPLRLIDSLIKQKPEEQARFSSQEIKNPDGETVLTFKDGKFIDEKGKEISEDKAFKIIKKLYKNDELGTLVQNFKLEE